MSLAEFLEWDDGTDRRYQLIDGVPVMMAPALEAHGELAVSVGSAIGNRIGPRGRLIIEAGLIPLDRPDSFYVADLAVTCASREPGRRHVVDPLLVVEILAPSTEGFHPLRKVMDYRRIPSVQAILLMATDERHVEVQRRSASGWTVEDLADGDELALDILASPIPLASIYGDLLQDPEAG